MAKQKVAILGASGMLGSMLLDLFTDSREFEVIATYRTQKVAMLLKNKYPEVDFRRLDVEKNSLKNILKATKGAGWIINAIGITKPYIHDDNASEISNAIDINSQFPHVLAQVAARNKSKVIQIATDCVYSGRKGKYIETDLHDALDVYGKTKSLGEVFGNNIYNLRCSVIGPELKTHSFLLDWFLDNPKGAEVNGFTNHRWNGITTLHFAQICRGIIKKGVKLPHIQHIIPGNRLTKADLLKSIAKEFNRSDIKVRDMEAPTTIDRTLSTNNKELNRKLWQLAGYSSPPKIAQMIRELAKI